MQPTVKANIGKESPKFYHLIYRIIWALSPKYTLYGTENLPDEPCVLVGNHCQMYGPIASELYLVRPHYIWCIGEMMNRKEVPAYAFQDFWSMKPKAVRWFYKLLSYVIAPLAEYVFTNAHTIPVRHDARVMTTFRASIEKLFEELMDLTKKLSEEERRYVREGFENDEQLSMYDLLMKDDLTKAEIKKIKEVAVELLEKIKTQLATMDHPFEKRETKAAIIITIRDTLWEMLPESYSDESIDSYKDAVFEYVQQRYGGVA